MRVPGRSLPLIALLFFALRASAQDDAAAPFANYPFRLRLEHISGNSSVCVLLRRDGQYHLEHTRGEKILVGEGRLGESDLARLNLALDSDQLRQISQQRIVAPLLYSSGDQLQLNVFRRDHWQNLQFPDSTTQSVYQAAIRPLLTWLHQLRNAPHRELSEDEGKNNCLVPEKLHLKIRGAEPPASEKTAAEPGGGGFAGAADARPGEPRAFLVRYARDRFLDNTFWRTCVVVGAAGGYRMERGRQQISYTKITAVVFEGSVSPSELEKLIQTLDEPRLKNERRQNRLPEIPIRDAEVISVSVPREKQTQHLLFSGYAGSRFNGQGAAVHSADDTSSIAPLEAWLRTAIEHKKVAPLKSAQPDNCASPP